LKEAESQARIRRFESRKPFLELQLRLYIEISEVLGRLNSGVLGTPEYEAAEKRFWSLYWGELGVVESRRVEELMIDIGKALKLCRENPSRESSMSDVRTGSNQLAHAIRHEIETAWGAEAKAAAVIDGQKSLRAKGQPLQADGK
jgi:hypothetical protein